jgi:hypothetical protein
MCAADDALDWVPDEAVRFSTCGPQNCIPEAIIECEKQNEKLSGLTLMAGA